MLNKEIFWEEFNLLSSQKEIKPNALLKEYNCNFFKTIDSTNTQLRLFIEQEILADRTVKDSHLFFSEEQTAGKGRLGRKFYSPKQTGLYFSLSFTPKDGVKDASVYTACSAVSVQRAIKKCFNKDAKIKWVNDIYIDGKKVCGILAEGVSNASKGIVESCVIGIGINLCIEEDIPLEIKEKAGGILNEKEVKDGDREKLLANVVFNLLFMLSTGENFIDEYRENSFLIGKTVAVTPVIGDSKSYMAQVLDITQDAGLLVRTQDGKENILHSGEVTLHGFTS